MTDKKLISVVIPTYNRSALVVKALYSVLKQTYKNFEIIVVDDNSTDNTKKIIKGIKDKHQDKRNKRIILIKNKHKKGPGGSRNTGMELAKGDYIAFLDSDDLFLKNHLSDCVSILEKHPDISLIFGRAVYMQNGKEVEYMTPNLIKKISSIKDKVDKGDYILFNKFLFDEILEKGCFFNLSTVVMRRTIIDSGFFQNEKLFGPEDYEYWQRISNYFKFAFIKKPQIIYNLHKENISYFSSEKNTKKHFNEFNELLKCYKVMLNYPFINKYQQKKIKKNIAYHYFNYGYYKKTVNRLKEARKYYLFSLKYHPTFLCLKALIKTYLTKFKK